MVVILLTIYFKGVVILHSRNSPTFRASIHPLPRLQRRFLMAKFTMAHHTRHEASSTADGRQHKVNTRTRLVSLDVGMHDTADESDRPPSSAGTRHSSRHRPRGRGRRRALLLPVVLAAFCRCCSGVPPDGGGVSGLDEPHTPGGTGVRCCCPAEVCRFLSYSTRRFRSVKTTGGPGPPGRPARTPVNSSPPAGAPASGRSGSPIETPPATLTLVQPDNRRTTWTSPL